MYQNLTRALVSSIVGTSTMTLSSWLMSLLGEDFREPEHLGTMAHRLLPLTNKKQYMAIGWAGHYGMGLAFAAVYSLLWERQQLRCTLKNGLLLGLASGVLGSAIWKATFKIHPLPPRINYNLFYLQRIPAHLVFALATTLIYKAMQNKSARPYDDRPVDMAKTESQIEKG